MQLPKPDLIASQKLQRRNQVEIMIAILNKIIEPSKKTHILYGVSLNYSQLVSYLQMLLELKLIEEIVEPFEGYRIADKGRLFLQLIGTPIK